MKSRKAKMSRLEKAKTNYSLSLVAYMLNPTEEGKIKMLQFGRSFPWLSLSTIANARTALTVASKQQSRG